jgi:hypothetical protein
MIMDYERGQSDVIRLSILGKRIPVSATGTTSAPVYENHQYKTPDQVGEDARGTS